MTEPTGADWLDQKVRITRDAVYFGDLKLPGLIAQDGVVVTPGGANDFNQVTVTFVVGEVHTEDPQAFPTRSAKVMGQEPLDDPKRFTA